MPWGHESSDRLKFCLDNEGRIDRSHYCGHNLLEQTCQSNKHASLLDFGMP